MARPRGNVLRGRLPGDGHLLALHAHYHGVGAIGSHGGYCKFTYLTITFIISHQKTSAAVKHAWLCLEAEVDPFEHLVPFDCGYFICLSLFVCLFLIDL